MIRAIDINVPLDTLQGTDRRLPLRVHHSSADSEMSWGTNS